MESFHESVKSWSRIKHAILGKYLELFVRKLGRLAKLENKKIYYIDGFAGQGIYEDGGRGSAFIAANFAASATGVICDVLRCINIEADPVTYARLERHTGCFKQNGIVSNLNKNFEDALDSVLRTIDQSPALFFIDPLGAKGTEVQLLEKISKRRGITEVLLRYDDIRIARMVGNIKGLKIGDEKAQKTAQSLINRLKGLTNVEVFHEVLSEHRVDRGIVMNSYIEEVVCNRGLFNFGLAYPITKPITGGHQYFLTHFCNFEDGYVHMANFMSWAERSGKKQIQDELIPKQQEEFEFLLEELRDSEKQTNIKTIGRSLPKITQIAKRKPEVKVRHFLAAIVDEFKWQYSRREAVAALKLCPLVSLGGVEDSSKVKIL